MPHAPSLPVTDPLSQPKTRNSFPSAEHQGDTGKSFSRSCSLPGTGWNSGGRTSHLGISWPCHIFLSTGDFYDSIKPSCLHETVSVASNHYNKNQTTPHVYSARHFFPLVDRPQLQSRVLVAPSPNSLANIVPVSTSCLASQYCSIHGPALSKTTDVFFFFNTRKLYRAS